MNEPITVVPRVIGAIIAVVLQIALAPNIALFGVVPNFIMAYVLIVSIVCPDQSGPVFAFVLGLLFDLLGTGPVGAMAFLLTGVSFLAKRIFMLVNNEVGTMLPYEEIDQAEYERRNPDTHCIKIAVLFGQMALIVIQINLFWASGDSFCSKGVHRKRRCL